MPSIRVAECDRRFCRLRNPGALCPVPWIHWFDYPTKAYCTRAPYEEEKAMIDKLTAMELDATASALEANLEIGDEPALERARHEAQSLQKYAHLLQIEGA